MLPNIWNWLFSRVRRKQQPFERRPRRVPLGVEVLEDRSVPATVNWINAAGGDWNVGANWSTGQRPGAADDVVIAQAGITITHASAVSDTIQSLSASNATLHLSAGTLNIAQASSLQKLTVSGGSLGGAGVLTVNGLTTFSGGAMTGAGKTIAGGGLALSGAATLDGRTLENNATATMTGQVPILYLQNGASIRNQNGAVWDLQGNALIETTDNSATTFVNLGTLQKSVATGAAHLRLALTNSAVVAVSSGTLHLKGGGSASGAFQLASGAGLELGAGTFQFSAGSSITGTGSFAITGGTANFSSGSPWALNNLTVQAGTLTGTDTVNVAGATTWTGGTMSGSGTTVAQGTLTLGSNLVLSQRTLSYTGSTPWSMPTGNIFILQNGGAFTYTTGATSPAPTLTATMTVALAIDNDGDTKADLGDTLKYTVTITNTGSTTAQNVAFTTNLDPHASLVPSSLSYPAPTNTLVASDADLAALVAAALARWQAVGLTAAQQATLTQARFLFADLQGLQIGQALGTTVLLDRLAGSHGWYVDASPGTDSEFTATASATRLTAAANSPAAGRLDLLTAVLRHMGTLVGFTAADMPDLMSGALELGTRNLPSRSSALTALRVAGGFHQLGNSYYQSAFGFQEKFFRDRNEQWYAVFPNGDLVFWDGTNLAALQASRTNPVANVGLAVYDDPTLLFQAPISLTQTLTDQLASLRTSQGFRQIGGSYHANAYGSNEKWFQNRSGAWHALLPDGNLIQLNAANFASSPVIATLSPLVFDDPTLLLQAPVSLTQAVTDQMASLRTSQGFRQIGGSYYQNAYGSNEKWFQNRSGAWHALLPNGNLIQLNASNFASSPVIATLSPLVYDEPTLLLNAPVSLSQAVLDQMASLRVSHGFQQFGGSYYQNAYGSNEKWFQNRSGAWHGLLPNGNLIQLNAANFASSPVIATLSPLVYDEPTLLFGAAVTLPGSTLDQLAALRLSHGFHQLGNSYYQNAFGFQEKFFRDRNEQWYAVFPNGDLVFWDGTTLASLQASRQRPLANVGVLVYDDPTLLFKAAVGSLPASVTAKMADFKATHGFQLVDKSYYQNVFGFQEKWFHDRNKKWHALLPNGDLIHWDGVNTASFLTAKANPIANLGPLVYDDPTQLFQTTVAVASSVVAEMTALRATHGFRQYQGSFHVNIHGGNEKWFHDRNANWFALLPNGDLIKFDGVSFLTSKANPLTNLGALVYDDPNILLKATAETSTVLAPLGDLAPGQSVTLTYQARIQDYLPAGVKTITTQSAISGANFATVLTDDPNVTGAANPTSMPVMYTSLFDDPDLEAAVQQVLGLSATQTVTKAQLLTVTSLTLDANQISSLVGLEWATNLQSLSLQPSDPTVATPLASLLPIIGLSSLKSLSIVGAGVTNSQISVLGSSGVLTGLKALDLRYNALTSVAALNQLASLATLQVYGNAVTDLTPLSGKAINIDLQPIAPEQAQTISDLALALYKNPIEIYEYVVNNFQNQYYLGLLKGAQATLETRAGNNWDQANLLRELLQASGATTRFVSGIVRMPVSTAINWLGVADQNGAGTLLASIGAHPQFPAGTTGILQFDHTWLQLQVTPTTWVDLDPTWKFRDFQVGVTGIVNNVFFDENAYLMQVRDETPAEYYAGQVASYLATNVPGATLADVPRSGPIRQQAFTALPTSTPYTVIGNVTPASAAPANVKATVQVTLKAGATTLLTHTLTTAEDSLKRVVIAYDDMGSGQLRAKLLLDGVAVATAATNVASGAAVSLTLVQTEPGLITLNTPATQTFTYQRQAGQVLAIGINALQVSDRLLQRQQADANTAASAAVNGTSVNVDQQIGAPLALALYRYFDRTAQSEALVTGLTGAVSIYSGNLTSGVATADAQVDFTSSLMIPAVPRHTSLEVQNYFHQEVDASGINTFNAVRQHLVNITGSDLEGAVLQELFNSPSVSTARAFEVAGTTLVPRVTFNSNTDDNFMPGGSNPMTLDPATIAAIQAELAAGPAGTITITVNRDPVTVGNWTGAGILVKNNNGAEKYLISGSTSGGPVTTYAGAAVVASPAAVTSIAANTDMTQTIVGTVNIANGDVVRHETDLHLPSVGLDLDFARHYHSLSNVDRGLGTGWSHSYSDYLSFNGNGSIDWTDATGALHTFTPDGSGGYNVPATIYGSFVATGSGYRYTDPKGLKRDFDLAGKLTAISDRNGNTLSLTYDGSSQLSTVSSASRTLTFTWTSGHITSISDGTGRTWSYSYTGNQLTQVAAPLGAPTIYTYHTGTALGGLLHQVTDASGAVTAYSYYSNRRAFQITDPAGVKQSFSYNLDRHLTTVDDARGHNTQYRYDAAGHVTRIIYADGATESFAWTGNLQTSATDALGNVESYLYDSQGNRTQVTDRAGHVTTTTYGAFSLPTSITQPGGRLTTFAYDANGNLTQITDALGQVTATTYDAQGRLLTRTTPRGTATGTAGDFTTTFTYNADGQVLTRSSDLPSTESYTYDARGRVATYTDANHHTTSYGYDALDRLTSITDANNKTTTHTYTAAGDLATTTDRLGRTTQHFYNATRQLIKTIHPDGGIESFQYDPAGHRVGSQDELGRTTTTVYDQRGRVQQIIRADGSSSQTRYDRAGRVVATTDANGNATKYTYDKLGQLLTTTNALGGVETRSYDAVGNLVSVTEPIARATSTVTIANGANATITWTGHGLSVGMAVVFTTTGTLPAGISVNTIYRVVAVPNGNTFQIAATLGGPAIATSSAGAGTHTATVIDVTQYQYDLLNRVTKVIDALGNATSTTYDANGNRLNVAAPLSQSTQFTYDVLDRLISQTNALGGVTQYTYDAAGNRLTITDPNTNTTTFTYDALNRLAAQINAATGATQTYGYDFEGNLTSKVDFQGRTTQYAYDGRNRLLNEQWLDASNNIIRTIRYAYDVAGQLIAASDADSSFRFSYDKLGRQITVDTRSVPGLGTVQTQYTHDAAGNVLTVGDLYGGTLKSDEVNTYDALRRLTRRNNVTFSYNANSEVTSIARFANQALTTQVATGAYTYDAAGRLTSLRYSRAATTLAQYGWSYDAAGRITQQTTSSDGTSSYTYSTTNQLLSATGPSESFSYDANGNRTGGTTITAGKLMSDGTSTYTYDNAGNLLTQTTAGAVTQYSWDHRQRLTRVTFKNAAGSIVKQVDYTYDVFDRRTAKAIDSDGAGLQTASIERYVYHGQDLVLQFNNAGTLTHHYNYAPNGHLLSDTNVAGTVTTWILTDLRGSVRDLLNASGTVIDHINYNSFGKVVSETAPTTNFLFAYAGQELDRETGLQYHGKRYYSPSLGRFISQSSSFADVNLYRYAGNNSINVTNVDGI